MATAITEFIPEIISDCPGCPIPTVKEHILKTVRDFLEHTELWVKAMDPVALEAYVDTYTLSEANADIVGAQRVEINHKKINPLSEKEEDADNGVWRSGTQNNPAGWMLSEENVIQLVNKPTEDSKVNYSLADLTFTASGNTIDTAAGDFVTALIQQSDILDIVGSTSNDGSYHLESVEETQIVTKEPLTDEGTADASATFLVEAMQVWAILVPDLTPTTVEDFIYKKHEDAIIYGTKARLMRMITKGWGNLQASTGFQDMYEMERGKAVRKKQQGRAKSRQMTRGGVGI